MENPAGQTRRRVNICRLALPILSRIRLKSGYRRSPLAAVSREQLRESSAPTNRNFDSKTARVCVTVKHGLRLTAAARDLGRERHGRAGARCSSAARTSQHMCEIEYPHALEGRRRIVDVSKGHARYLGDRWGPHRLDDGSFLVRAQDIRLGFDKQALSIECGLHDAEARPRYFPARVRCSL
jgi:hypothetical protein